LRAEEIAAVAAMDAQKALLSQSFAATATTPLPAHEPSAIASTALPAAAVECDAEAASDAQAGTKTEAVDEKAEKNVEEQSSQRTRQQSQHPSKTFSKDEAKETKATAHRFAKAFADQLRPLKTAERLRTMHAMRARMQGVAGDTAASSSSSSSSPVRLLEVEVLALFGALLPLYDPAVIRTLQQWAMEDGTWMRLRQAHRTHIQKVSGRKGNSNNATETAQHDAPAPSTDASKDGKAADDSTATRTEDRP
jgi:hypothetical protein